MSDPFADPDLIACAQIVEKGDPDRFAAAMAAPVQARVVLFPIYAFNVEVARAPWVTQEPLIAQMRLQWWTDVLEEIACGGPVRRHEVATPLAGVIDAEAAKRLQTLVAARHLDIERAPFEDDAALGTYLQDTAGSLAAVAAQTLGASAEGAVIPWAKATGLVRYLQAVPELEARGKLPLPDGRAEAVQSLARSALRDLSGLGAAVSLRGLRKRLGTGPDAAVIEFWQTKALLTQIAKEPARVAEGRVGLSDFARRWRLLAAAL
ncbi:MAG: squalene/phytoene synthase family protein [Paracoccaceae bacterium]|nr:squalene/phytoene synthase family protein [Paracoccaceae bacterium]